MYGNNHVLDPTAHAVGPGVYPDNQIKMESYEANTDLPRKTNENPARRNTAPPPANGVHLCNCCPKKPKKFDTAEELR